MLKKYALAAIRSATRVALHDPEVQRLLWKAVHQPNPELVSGPVPHNTWLALWNRASSTTADYVEQHMLKIPVTPTRYELFDLALEQTKVEGLYLEFGSAYGRTANYIAKRIDSVLHGFDSFEGLPEDWFTGLRKGHFDRADTLPEVEENVELHVGWFDQTLPAFLAEHDEPAAFIHIDCDLYSSTRTVFEALAPRIGPGTVIFFGEYFNYPGWQHHEYKAFQEFVAANDLTYEYLGYSNVYHVAVRIT